MYQSSSSPVFPDRAANLARKAAASDARIAQSRLQSVEGRKRLFNTLISPAQALGTFGAGTAVDVQRLQDDTLLPRAAGILGRGTQSVAQPENYQPPTVVPVSFRAASCTATPVMDNPNMASFVPGMPERAPSNYGAAALRGDLATVPGTYGLSGVGPAWGDASDAQILPEEGGIMGWIADNPILSIGIAGVGVYLLARGAR